MSFHLDQSKLSLLQAALACLFLCAGLAAGRHADAQEWRGPFVIAPYTAPEMVLEAVGGGGEGTIVSIGKPTGQPNQTWVLTPRGAGLYAIKPSYNERLALSAAAGGTQNGTRLVLETDAAKPWQIWRLRRESDGAVSFVPQHTTGKAMDDLGGGKEPGAEQDIWSDVAGDQHLHWRMRPQPGAVYPANLAREGVVKEWTFNDSKIYPGTVRNGAVFIPAEYDASKPACVYVRQDGYNPAEKGMLEQLIAAGDMPVTVGVFVSPGQLPAPEGHRNGRRNRSLEYDGMGDTFVRFITEEILPFVTRKFGLNLSTSGNDRCIAGASSGGICAFNAAWERPDAFTRVYCNSGSFAAYRGGHEFPTLIRKFEPRPIRSYMTTATHDVVNYAGEWILLDQEIAKALEFSGYEFEFHVIEGPHVAGWNERFPDAMRFIWKGWPAPVPAGHGSPRLHDLLIPGQGWQPLAAAVRDVREAASGSGGKVYFVDSGADGIYRIDGDAVTLLHKGGHNKGLAVGADGDLYALSLNGKLTRYDATGRPRSAVSGVWGRHLAAAPSGGLYVTGAGSRPGERSRVLIVRDGKQRLVDKDPKRATGIAVHPDGWLLAIADGGSNVVFSYRIAPDGSLADKERFYWLHVADGDDDCGAESLCYSREGLLFVATRMGIQICNEDGHTEAIVPLPGRVHVTALCFGGPEGNTLYAFGGGKIWRRSVNAHAAPTVPSRIGK
jgi:enterochelin esterase-like enzyme/sugar lactone lactonase YvrE